MNNKTKVFKKYIGQKLISFLVLLFLFVYINSANAQRSQGNKNYESEKARTEEIVRMIADRIITSTSYTFVNTETGEKYTNLKNVGDIADALDFIARFGLEDNLITTLF